MKDALAQWLRIIVLGAQLLLLVGIVAAPLVFTDAVIANYLRILELIARAS